MKKIVAVFSGRAYDETTWLTVERGPQMGADEVVVFDDRWLIDQGFRDANRWLYDATPTPLLIQGDPQNHPHGFGFGWCAWKAFIVLSAFDRLQGGDVVLYMDADTYPVAPFGQLFDACSRAGGMFVFAEAGASSLRFTKADCFRAMGLPIQETTHACGRCSLWQKGPFLTRQVLTEWWAYSVNPRCMFWDKSILGPDQPEYHRNSTEQSVLTNLALKYSIPLHRTPDQFGGAPPAADAPDADLYGQVFEQRYCTGNRLDLGGSSFFNAAPR